MHLYRIPACCPRWCSLVNFAMEPRRQWLAGGSSRGLPALDRRDGRVRRVRVPESAPRNDVSDKPVAVFPGLFVARARRASGARSRRSTRSSDRNATTNPPHRCLWVRLHLLLHLLRAVLHLILQCRLNQTQTQTHNQPASPEQPHLRRQN